MSGDSRAFRMGTDLQERVDELAEDYDISPHKAGLRAMDRGLQVLGYSDINAETTSIGRTAGEGGKALAIAGVAFFIAITIPPALGQVLAAVCLATAILGLMIERAEPYVSNALGVPKETQHPEVVTDGGGEKQ